MNTLILLLSFLTTSLYAAVDNTLVNDCNKGNGLACAKVAYSFKKTDQLKAYEFYKKGCDLKDETSCYNMKNLDPEALYFKKANGILKFHEENVMNCYVPASTKAKYSTMQYKEVWYTANLIIHVGQDGRADSVTVNTSLPKTFIDCAKEAVKRINFPKPEGVDPTFHHKLTMSFYE